MRSRALAAVLTAAWALGLSRPVSAQISVGEGNVDRYDALYGQPVDVAVDDLVQESTSYLSRAVRTHGRLELGFDSTQRAYLLRGLLYQIRIVPVREVQTEWEQAALQMMGRDVEITGVFLETGQVQGANPAFGVQFWNFTGPPEKEPTGEIKAPEVSLEKLVSNPGKRDGQMIRVVGKFRGRNLYGDLPIRTQRTTADWVIKDDLYAIWVTGKKPKGAGWELDSGLKRDTGKWVEVIGKPETVRGVTYIKAVRIQLTTPPSARADVKPPPPPPEKPRKAPVVVFALPLDGDGEVAPDSRFVVQFSKDMDESTFNGHVLLRYTGPVLPGDRAFDGLKLTYDRGRRALTVDPGDVLRPRRQIELILLPGISDIDGLTLIPRGTSQKADVVDVLRYRVGS
ncbi:MAG TPA: Ig-like domain-containing protein [Vicinamibacteria bacterium]|nr:Ig-like domain-containing protein [Vicinamibacteria bacterium]